MTVYEPGSVSVRAALVDSVAKTVGSASICNTDI